MKKTPAAKRGRGPGRIHPVDLQVGAALRQARRARGLSQTTLAEAAGITFQQVQKYERGANRVSASRLFEFAEILDLPIGYFFGSSMAGRQDDGTLAGLEAVDMDIVAGLRGLDDRPLKQVILQLVKGMHAARPRRR